jgi:hypothetical protein
MLFITAQRYLNKEDLIVLFMKKITLIIFTLLSITYSYAQPNVKDSLKQLLLKETTDTGRVLLLANLSSQYIEYRV